MTAEQRRDRIVRAALPSVAELGAGVTTAKIARAAGIGEATILGVFEDKNAVLTACVAAAMDPAQVLSELFEPDRDELRLNPEAAADTLLGLFSGRGRFPGTQDTDVSTAGLVEVFLHGTLAGK